MDSAALGLAYWGLLMYGARFQIQFCTVGSYSSYLCLVEAGVPFFPFSYRVTVDSATAQN
jgi:hypothetical protein